MAIGDPVVVTEAEIFQILGQEKFLPDDLDWKEKPSDSLFLTASSTLTDSTGATIPRLTVELHYIRGFIADECKYLFTVFILKGNTKKRVYQIEVVPPEKRSHNDESGPWYGPHQHFGEVAHKFPEETKLGCAHHEGWFNMFLNIANIKFGGKYIPPERQLRL